MKTAADPSNEPDLLRLRTCPQCEYALDGLADAAECPECGRPYDPSVAIVRCRGFAPERINLFALVAITVLLVGAAAVVVARWPHLIKMSPNGFLLLIFAVVMLSLSWIDRFTSERVGVWLLWITPLGMGVQTEFDPQSPTARARKILNLVFWPAYLMTIFVPTIATRWWIVPLGCALVTGALMWYVERASRGKPVVRERGVQPDLMAWKDFCRLALWEQRPSLWRLRAYHDTWVQRRRVIDVSFNATAQLAAQIRARVQQLGGVVTALLLLLLTAACASAATTTRPAFSGVYPHLAFFNDDRECGTGAVVPWAGRLWAVTYGPHSPMGSTDKLYEIDQELNLTVRPESIGGTPANRMIHRESRQLFIGPYAIDERRNVRAIPYEQMPGRPTANMRHLFSPADKIYCATMEEGFYEIDVKTLAVKELYPDGNKMSDIANPLLPGYHGKGAYTGQGRVAYANNGERSAEAKKRPDVPSGCLAEWDGKDWRIVRRNQFTEVTGPGGICGNERDDDPIWSIGWDHRSLILMLLDGGKWHSFRLPKATHTYDGAHGWNTEWPRIRDIGEDDLLMTMHGTFWRFPRTFSAANTKGIRPRSTYLKVIGDFAKWNDHVVFGCDDAAKSEFLNKRAAKGNLAPPGQSQSNLWFVSPQELDTFGEACGSGAVWLNDEVKAGEWSDAFLFAGYKRRGVHLVHDAAEPVTFTLEVDGQPMREMKVRSGRYEWVAFAPEQKGEWVRVKADRDARVTALFNYSSDASRSRDAETTFSGVAKAADTKAFGGLLYARGDNKRTLQLATADGSYELDADVKLKRLDDLAAHEWVIQNAAIPQGVLSVDAASVLFIDDNGKRWRLPKGDAAFDAMTGKGMHRICREVCTERDLFNAHGTFYELPAENAGGFAKIRPITTHNRRIIDYCSYRGMIVMTGVEAGAPGKSIIRSDDRKAGLWAGVIDDLWKFGKPRGVGGPWKETEVKANVPSDPYLMHGYDKKRLTLSADRPTTIRVEVDLTGDGHWMTYTTQQLEVNHCNFFDFEDGYQAHWLRVTADTDCTATAWLEYNNDNDRW